MTMDQLAPRDPAEAIAIFRAEIIGALTRREWPRGELGEALEALSQQRWRPPRAASTRTYSVVTLERWYYAYRAGGLEALHPRRRRDRGRARDLTVEQRDLLLQIRREHPTASVPLILRTLVADGRLERGAVAPQTVRRLFRAHGVERGSPATGAEGRLRLRWQAERPGTLWHGDVCHGPALTIAGGAKPLRIHGLLDDASRYVIALEAHHAEREVDLLGVLVRALRRHGVPDALYLDNGATYRGDILRVACARLGVTLLHARPYDAPARGKMERFWRTLREGCLAFLGPMASLHDVNVRLWAFLDAHYHQAPHAGLLGRAPATVYEPAVAGREALDDDRLRNALTVRVRRRVRRDATVPLDGTDYEIDQGFLAGRLVTVARCLVDLAELPWVEHEGKRLPLHPVDPTRNARRTRARPPDRTSVTTVAFDPPRALLDRAVHRFRDTATEEDAQ
jgi:transposase InsO family protein